MHDQRFACPRFGEPIEASVYFFEHHRYDAVELIVAGQRGAQLSIQARASGDIDGLGIPEISVDATVVFGGTYVQVDAVGTDTGSATESLGRFTDTDGLQPRLAVTTSSSSHRTGRPPRGHEVVTTDPGSPETGWLPTG